MILINLEELNSNPVALILDFGLFWFGKLVKLSGSYTDPENHKRQERELPFMQCYQYCWLFVEFLCQQDQHTSVNIASGGSIVEEFGIISCMEQSMEIREGTVSAPGSQQTVAVSRVKWSCFKADWAVT